MNTPSLIELLEKESAAPLKIQPIVDRLRERLRQTQQESSPQKPREYVDVYWGVAEIADYLSLSKQTVRAKIITDPRWPTPIACGGSVDRPIKRWLASDVKKALLRFSI